MDAGAEAHAWRLWEAGSVPESHGRQPLGSSLAIVGLANPELQGSSLDLAVCLTDLVLYKNIPAACRRRKSFPEARAVRRDNVYSVLACDRPGPQTKHLTS